MQSKSSVTATIGEKNYTTRLSTRQFEFYADEPKEQGGQNKGATPIELLKSSLASCIAITVRMYTERKNWEVGHIQVSVDFTEQDNGELILQKEISFENSLTEEQIERILNVAKKCPVAKLLANGVHQTTKITRQNLYC